MLESLLLWLTVAFVVVTVGAVLGYFALRWVFMRAAEKMVARSSIAASAALRRTRSPASRASRRRAASPLDEAQPIFGVQIDRLARIMDSAITLPIVGRVGLDAVLDLIPVFGNFAGAAVSLTLIARTLQYGAAAVAGVEDAVERPRRRDPRRHSRCRPAGRHVVEGERQECGADAGIPRGQPTDL